MEFSIKNQSLDSLRCACIVVAVSDPKNLAPCAAQLDQASSGLISRTLKQGDLPATLGRTLLLTQVPGVAAQRVLLVHAGSGAGPSSGAGTGAGSGSSAGAAPAGALDDAGYRTLVRSALQALDGTRIDAVLMCLPEVAVRERDVLWKLEQLVEVARASVYRAPRVGAAEATPAHPVRQVLVPRLLFPEHGPAQLKTVLGQAQSIANGIALTRDLGNLPPNVCTPAYLADEARKLARTWKLKVEVLERAALEKLGMGALLAVAAGSRQPPKLIVLHYQGAVRTRKPVVLVGKGITFDSGGISLKPAPEMDEMKFDMCGAASVLGTMRAVAEMGLPLNLIGIIPACENMPDGNATRPGDVVRSLSGQTIEILNTDAEGRLILCDALTYARRFRPAVVIDVATLTGACVIALGHEAAGLFANDADLGAALQAAGEVSGDRVWPLPLWDSYQDALKSNFADLANVGGRPGGSITAACFLSRFTHDLTWAHLDIAGVAYRGGKDKGASGRPVGLFCHYLRERCES